MISPENSRKLAKIKQIAKINGDIKMINKLESIEYDYEITPEILNYEVKTINED